MKGLSSWYTALCAAVMVASSAAAQTISTRPDPVLPQRGDSLYRTHIAAPGLLSRMNESLATRTKQQWQAKSRNPEGGNRWNARAFETDLDSATYATVRRPTTGPQQTTVCGQQFLYFDGYGARRRGWQLEDCIRLEQTNSTLTATPYRITINNDKERVLNRSTSGFVDAKHALLAYACAESQRQYACAPLTKLLSTMTPPGPK